MLAIKKNNVTKCYTGPQTWKNSLDKQPQLRKINMIKTGLREIGWGGFDWIHLPQNRDQW
jgi:hypothetical protein